MSPSILCCVLEYYIRHATLICLFLGYYCHEIYYTNKYDVCAPPHPQSVDAVAKGRVSVEESIVEELVREFSSNWKSGIQQINDDVTAHFANFRNGMEILKQVSCI